MEGMTMDGRDGEQIQSVQEMFRRFTAEMIDKIHAWSEQLTGDPASVESLERDVHTSFARGADMAVAGLIAVAMAQESFKEAGELTRKRFSCPLRKGRERTISVRLLGGMLVWATNVSPRTYSAAAGCKRCPSATTSSLILSMVSGLVFGSGSDNNPQPLF